MGETDNSSFLMSMTSEFFFTLHLLAKYSVTPTNLFLNNSLLIGQFIRPKVFFLSKASL